VPDSAVLSVYPGPGLVHLNCDAGLADAGFVAAVSVFRAHAAHFIVFGIPVLGLVATVGWQELRNRWSAYPDSGGSAERARAVRPLLDRESIAFRLVAVGLFSSALIHASVIREHYDEYFFYGLFFTLLAIAQAAVGVLVLVRPEAATVRVVAVAGVWVVALWLVSRTTGLPIGPERWRPEGWGALDTGASCAELVTAIACWSALRHQSPRQRRPAGNAVNA
jgi:hypothetical protein